MTEIYDVLEGVKSLHGDGEPLSKLCKDLKNLPTSGNVMSFTAVVSNLGPPDVFGLQLPKIPAIRGGGEGFWELSSKNIWRPKVGNNCCKGHDITTCRKVLEVLAESVSYTHLTLPTKA